MDTVKHRKSLSLLYLAAIVASMGLLILPATRWMATSQIAANFVPFGSDTNGWLRYEMGVKDDLQVNVKAINDKISRTAEAEPKDYGMQYAAILLMTPKIPKEANNAVESELSRLFALLTNFRDLPRANADFLRRASRNMSVGRDERQSLASDFLSSQQNRPVGYRPEVDRAELLGQMRDAAQCGAKSEPENAFFPLMEAVVLFAQKQDAEALEHLHLAANCPRCEDYAIDEAIDLNRLSQQAFGKQSVITNVIQGASVLLPHYAQIRNATRLAVVSAIDMEAGKETASGLRIREDILKVGHLLRSQSHLLIGNLVGSGLEDIAGSRAGGVPQVENREGGSTKLRDKRVVDTLSRFTAYLDAQGRNDLSRFVRDENAAKEQIKTISEKGMPLSAYGGKDTFLLGLWHTVGAVLLANVFWLVLFGGMATFLLKRKMNSMRPALLIIACWFAIATFYTSYNAPNQAAYGSVVTILYNLSSDNSAMGDSVTLMRLSSLLSVAVPFGLALLICAVSLFSRVPLGLGLLRGLRGLCLPAAAVLILLWVPVIGVTAAKEQTLHTDYQGFLQHEGRHLAGLTRMKFPE